jgi:D-serine deaminase-like pyridoxal phosphate-dependent protein
MISFDDKSWSDVTKPTLIIRPDIAKANIARMAQKAHRSGVAFRPHFKTHQSAQVGEWFREAGVSAITVSSVAMAHYFADAGWNDITIAFPVNIRELGDIQALAKRITLHLLVETTETVQLLAQTVTAPVNLWIKIDTGYKRTGIHWEDTDKQMSVVSAIKQYAHLSLRGLLTYNARGYDAKTPEAMVTTYHEIVSRSQFAQQALETKGVSTELSIGDTPCCSVVTDFQGVTEIRPGNFVFYDFMQLALGSCSQENIALAVACPVVAKHPERGTAIIYGGAVHLSKDFVEVAGVRKFGVVALPDTEQNWLVQEGAFVSALSQEHGTVKLPPALLEQLSIGDLLLIVPAHSCLAVNDIRQYRTLEGKTFAAWS